MLWSKRKTTYSDPRKDPRWAKWRRSVFRRDRYVCQICGNVGGKLHPHHVISKMLFPEYTFRIMNGITLCEKCHTTKRVHSEKYNRYVKRFAQYTRLKLPTAKRYHIRHKEH